MKDVDRVMRQARAQGWVVRRNGSGHMEAVSPRGVRVTATTHPGPRTFHKIRAHLRQAGAVIDGR
jgi:predicted RNA binding protein YcfA (HicA-like mRNA interferase family)